MDRDFQALLEGSPLLGDLDDLSRTALCMHFQADRFAPGEVLLQAGATGDRMLLVLQGQVQVRLPAQDEGAPMVLAELGADQLLGEVAFFGQDIPRTADAVAVEGEVVAAQLTRETYDTMLQTDPGAAETLEKVVLDVMLERISSTNQRMVDLVAQHSGDGTFRAVARMIARKL